MSAPARLRGSHFQTFRRVILPLAGPALAGVGVLQFQGTWNGWFWPLVSMNQAKDHWTLPVGLTQLQGAFHTNWPPLMALIVITTIPILALYVYFQSYFVEGIAAAGVKG